MSSPDTSYGVAKQLDTVILWFRRDLRLYDNPALVAALNSARNVIPLYIWAAEEEGQFQPGRQTRWWAKHSVMCLGQRLEQLGTRLVIRRACESVLALKEFIQESGAQAVFFNHLYDSISMVRDQQVKDDLRSNGVLVSSFNADLLYEPWEVLDEQQQPYTTFKSYWDRCLAMPYAPPLPLPEPSGPLPAVPAHLRSLSVQEVDWFFTREQEASTEALAHRWDPSGQAAVARLESFLEKGLPSFEHDRAKTDRDSTTMLSPWIHFGSISVRHIYYRVAQKHAEWQACGLDKGKSCLDFLQQMGYREYSRYLAFHYPFITERSMLAHLRAVPWRLDQDAFKAWRQGLTGYPLVDAGMRQLWSMGWCHNRVRVVASHFMVKHLLLPWQWGLKHLWDCQIDADLECDALGWQYISGCLSDAHPFSYLVDMEEEWKRFDPDGNYVRRWLPVLSQLPNEYIHQPWKAPPEILEEAGVELGFNYPWPIITPDAAKEGVAMASAVVERCAASSGSSGSSSGTGYNSLLPRKEPYRPPTDPALMSSFLAASREGFSWQEKLPPLYIHSATGHPLSLHHSAQQRPMWGPSLKHSTRQQQQHGYHDNMGRYFGLHRGRMGQQQLLLGPAAAAAGVPEDMMMQRSGSGSDSYGGYSQSQEVSGSGSVSYTAGSVSYSQVVESETADNSAAMMDDVTSSGQAGSDEPGSLPGKRRKQHVEEQQQLQAVGGALPAESSEQQVVPSASEGVGVDGWRSGGGAAAAWKAAGRGGRYRQRDGYDVRAPVGGDDADVMEDDGEYGAGEGMTESCGGYPAMSLTTAGSRFNGPGKQAGGGAAWGAGGVGGLAQGIGNESVGEDDAQQMEEEGGQAEQQGAGDLMLVADAARLQHLELQRSIDVTARKIEALGMP